LKHERSLKVSALCAHVQASAIDPNYLQYREKWLSPEATANLAEDQAREQIHNAMKILDPSFDIPDISEGIDTLTHIRSQADMDQVTTWLGNARQHVSAGVPGWSTNPPPSAKAAADHWMRVRI
jgi:hypothetical protein